MKVVIDTTVFGQGFNSRSAEVRLLKGFLERTPAELCVPSIVIDEAVNLVRKSIDDVNHKLDATLRLTGDHKTYDKLDVKIKSAVYREGLEELLRFLKSRVLPYPKVEHQELVARALTPIKPFVSSGRGYRDALIWFSILELARDCSEEIAFISGNPDDWCQGKKDIRLHGELISDRHKNGINPTRLRFFASLGEFTQQCAIATLPVSSASADTTVDSPDYQQLLIDGKEWVEAIVTDALPEFLRTVSRADARVGEVEVLATGLPSDIQSMPIRTLDSERRLLQFSADYRIASQFLIQKSDLAVWSQCIVIHQRQDWDDGRFLVQTTMAIRVSFNMIERGEQTEAFSIVSMSRVDGY